MLVGCVHSFQGKAERIGWPRQEAGAWCLGFGLATDVDLATDFYCENTEIWFLVGREAQFLDVGKLYPDVVTDTPRRSVAT